MNEAPNVSLKSEEWRWFRSISRQTLCIARQGRRFAWKVNDNNAPISILHCTPRFLCAPLSSSSISCHGIGMPPPTDNKRWKPTRWWVAACVVHVITIKLCVLPWALLLDLCLPSDHQQSRDSSRLWRRINYNLLLHFSLLIVLNRRYDGIKCAVSNEAKEFMIMRRLLLNDARFIYTS